MKLQLNVFKVNRTASRLSRSRYLCSAQSFVLLVSSLFVIRTHCSNSSWDKQCDEVFNFNLANEVLISQDAAY